MPDWWIGKPLLIAVALLFPIVFLRAQLTYWIARGVTGGVQRSRWNRALSQRRVLRAVELINRWGPPVVTVSFLTIGFQTVANAAAGLTRMPFPRYLLAMVPGCVAWAFLYATVGMAAVVGAVAVAARSPWALVVVAALLIALVAVLLRRRSARPTGSRAVAGGADAEGGHPGY